jgi:hypothetical protein
MSLDLMDESAERLKEHYAFATADGIVEGGPFTYDRQDAFRAAAIRLIQCAAGEPADAPDARFGRDLVAVLEAAQASAEAGGAWRDVPR